MPQAPITTASEARRLARLIASDLVLYNGARIDAAIAGDELFVAMAHELDEGRTLYQRRVAPGVDDAAHLYNQAIVDVLVASRAGIVSPMW